jgi:integrase
MAFYTGPVLRSLGLSLEHFPAGLTPELREKLQDEALLRKLCDRNKKVRWLQVFVREILRSDLTLPRLRFAPTRPPVEDTDVHRLSREELEQLEKVAAKDTLNELLFLTLLTTGMRVGSFACMKCADVVELRGGKWVAREQGRTLDKGAKFFSFHLTKRVQELMGLWFNKHRPVEPCEFVFPGRGGAHVSTNRFWVRFRRMCQEANLEGRRFHPHSLRHCFAHILLEVGNPAEKVSRVLNHESVSTTQKYYLRESAAQACDRLDVPWLQQRVVKDPVPSFLAREARHTPAQDSARTLLADLRTACDGLLPL